MQPKSRVILIVCAVLFVLLVAYFVPLFAETRPQFTHKDAEKLMDDLAVAFRSQNASKVVAFAFPDAKVAGQKLEVMHEYLKRGFAAARHLEVDFQGLNFKRQGSQATIDVRAVAGEKPPGSAQMTSTYYNQPVTFTVTRRATPQLFGLFETYQWKISEVEAAQLPNIENPF